jgi:O-methyltransferase involved in polyketide biosynthesis
MNQRQAQLGDVQQTLFIPLAARAQETARKHPVLRDPKAVAMMAALDFDAAKYGKGAGGGIVVLRTAIYDYWVRAFQAQHPAGTVVELGTGLNTRFERVDNGQVHWIDLDLPDTIELRRRFFADTDRRQMIAASVLDEDWRQAVARPPGRWPASRARSPGPTWRWTPTPGQPCSASTRWRPSGGSPGGPGRATTWPRWNGSACG